MPKSPARLACEQNEIEYANRTRTDYLKGASRRMLKDIGTAALSGAAQGAKAGAGSGELIEPLGGGVPGALVGGFVGAVTYSAAATIGGGFKEIANQYLYDNSFLGFGGTYQRQLAANIQKHCAGL